jgi:hypothetical protein
MCFVFSIGNIVSNKMHYYPFTSIVKHKKAIKMVDSGRDHCYRHKDIVTYLDTPNKEKY